MPGTCRTCQSFQQEDGRGPLLCTFPLAWQYVDQAVIERWPATLPTDTCTAHLVRICSNCRQPVAADEAHSPCNPPL